MESDAREGADPALLVTFIMKMETLVDSFVRAFTSPVGLRVKTGGSLTFDTG